MKKSTGTLLFFLGISIFLNYKLFTKTQNLIELSSVSSSLSSSATASGNEITFSIPSFQNYSYYIISSPYSLPDELNLNKLPEHLRENVPYALDDVSLNFHAITVEGKLVGGTEFFCPEETRNFFAGNVVIIENTNRSGWGSYRTNAHTGS